MELFLLTFVPAEETLDQLGEASFARGGWEVRDTRKDLRRGLIYAG